MNYKKNNKKGFTLTELIVVIVIIGILAAVLIPTLTGYITKAKKSAAEQEAQSYINAFMSWQIETNDEDESLDSFKNYCIDLELVKDKTEADEKIISLDTNNKLFVVKAKDYYVTWENGVFSLSEEHPDKDLIEKRNEFNTEIIEANVELINNTFANKEASLILKKTNSDGSVNVEVVINSPDSKAIAVYEPVTKAIDIIKNEGNGKSIYVSPIINGEEISIEKFKNKAVELLGTSVEQAFPMQLGDNISEVGMWISQVLTYDDNFKTVDEWTVAWDSLLSGSLGDLVGKNGVKVIANIGEGEQAYSVVYYFNFVNAE